MSTLNEFIKSRVHNILWNAGYKSIRIDQSEWKRIVHTPGEWQEEQNYYISVNADEWYYNKPQRGNADDIMAFGDYSPEGLDKLRKVVTIDPTESE